MAIQSSRLLSLALRSIRTIGAGVLLAALSHAQVVLAATLDGAQETPPNASPGTGLGGFTFDTGTSTLSWNITFSGMIGIETDAHIHQGAPGVPGGIVFAIPLGSPSVGSAALTPAQTANLLAGNFYVNLHTSAFPGGELRGQILVVPSSTIVCEPGVGGVLACPCANPPAGAGQGCNNKFNTGGASMISTGYNVLSNPTLQFTTAGENPTVFSIMLQGATLTTGSVFGHGVRCMTAFKRMYSRTCAGGSITFPDFGLGDANIPARAAALSAPISAGEKRWYQVYYRDTTTTLGGDPNCALIAFQFNITASREVTWLP